MILVDTSVWVDHLRKVDAKLSALLVEGQALAHGFVTGELALGNLRGRARVLSLLADLPQAAMAGDDEVLSFIEHNSLAGLGIGYVDAHLLAAARLNNVRLWTRDKRLHQVAMSLSLAADLN